MRDALIDLMHYFLKSDTVSNTDMQKNDSTGYSSYVKSEQTQKQRRLKLD